MCNICSFWYWFEHSASFFVWFGEIRLWGSGVWDLVFLLWLVISYGHFRCVWSFVKGGYTLGIHSESEYQCIQIHPIQGLLDQDVFSPIPGLSLWGYWLKFHLIRWSLIGIVPTSIYHNERHLPQTRHPNLLMSQIFSAAYKLTRSINTRLVRQSSVTGGYFKQFSPLFHDLPGKSSNKRYLHPIFGW